MQYPVVSHVAISSYQITLGQLQLQAGIYSCGKDVKTICDKIITNYEVVQPT